MNFYQGLMRERRSQPEPVAGEEADPSSSVGPL